MSLSWKKSPAAVSARLMALVFAAVLAAAAAGVAFDAGRAPAEARGPVSVADIAEGLGDAVVNIATSQTVKGSKGLDLPQVPKGSPFEEFFEDFFNKQQGKPRQVNSLGSGFVIDPNGIIVTNNHVIESADEIIVNFSDGTKLKVEKVLGRDSQTDLAVMQVKPEKPLKAVRFGDSAKMRVGDWVMAIGNPFGLGGTLTVGVISAKKRDINAGAYDEFIQTDAAINRGNSGGPLFNMEGEVIGVNTAIISPTGGSIGIGFAVPSNTAINVIDQLRQFGEVRRGWLGVRIQNVTDGIAESLGMKEPKGALVASVTAAGPAEAAGIQTGDVIMKFDGQEVANMRGLPRIVALTPIGKSVEVELLRNDKRLTVRVQVGRQPDQDKEASAEPAQKDEEKRPDSSGEKFSALGLSLSAMTDELRSRFKIGAEVKGVVITEVDPSSTAAQKGINAGDVIVEVTQEEVQSPEEVVSKVDKLKASGRKSVLLFISDGKGDVRFVAIPVGG
ncbi:MAG: Do family serine endopeptidase [Hyphomicrobiales bacterium]